jgi:hypothetical protein
VSLAELPQELQQLRGATDGYLLEPDGLVFRQPVQATYLIDKTDLPEEEPENGIAAYALVSYSDEDAREILPGQSTLLAADQRAVVVTAELSHLSYLGLTRGSLQLELERVPRQQQVGSSFTAQAAATNANPETAHLEEPEGLFGATGRVSVAPGREGFMTPESEEELNGEGWSRDGQYVCANEPGAGTYSVSARATSVVEVRNVGPISTDLAVSIQFDVECVRFAGPTATPAPPGATPTRLAEGGGPPTVGVVVTAGCEHTQPGVESELRVRVRVRLVDEDGEPAAGLLVDAQAQGQGLIDTMASGTTDDNGEVVLVFRINRFGPYGVTVQRISQPDGTLAVFEAGARLSTTFNVEQECTPPT